MRTFVKSFLAVTVVGLFLASPLADAVNNQPVDKNDPVVKCQEGCKSNKSNDSYEACMMQCKKTHKKADEKELKLKK